MSIRTQRVGEEIRKVISQKLIRGLKLPLPGFVTISDVEVSGDLRIAKVFYSVFGSDEEVKEASRVLELEKKTLRYEVGQKVKLRLVPELILVRDDTPKNAARISELLGDVKPQS